VSYNHGPACGAGAGGAGVRRGARRALGISRAAVWKAVQPADRAGRRTSRPLPGRGYRLAEPLSLLDAGPIRACVAGRRSRPASAVLEVLPETDSTNARVLAAEHPVGELVACLAEYQSAGAAGAAGAGWRRPAAGICLSVGGRLAAAPSDLPPAGRGRRRLCARRWRGWASPGVGLKWPNDLLLGGAKLGGILIELRGESHGPVTMAIGHRPERAARRGRARRDRAAGGLPAADLAAACGVAPERNRLAAALVAALARASARQPRAGRGAAGGGDNGMRFWAGRCASTAPGRVRDRARPG
jgi:BirA family transcriptional regulator, biotin operon repressor / biotin---[acetyl-CoA-carboxylase] ligase